MFPGVNEAQARVGAALVLSAVLLGAVSPAQAQYHQQQVAKVGSFEILKITEGGKFNRCTASKGSGATMLRIAFGANRQHYMSIPGVEGSGKAPMRIRFDGKPPIDIVPHAADKNRASVELDYPTVDRLMAAKRLEVSLKGNTYTWDLSGQSMEAVMRAVSNCTGNASN